ncbi:MAG: hypothetical protein ACMXYE_03235 [Candidatus Woesearchaeota archaeon]
MVFRKSSKKSDNAKKDDSGMFYSAFKEILSGIVFATVSTWVKDMIHNFQRAVYITTKKVIESLLALALLILGICMIMLSLPFLLSYYLNLPASLFFVIIGSIVIIIALITFEHISKTKYQNEKED